MVDLTLQPSNRDTRRRGSGRLSGVISGVLDDRLLVEVVDVRGRYD